VDWHNPPSDACALGNCEVKFETAARSVVLAEDTIGRSHFPSSAEGQLVVHSALT
jgi:hypothetical protein